MRAKLVNEEITVLFPCGVKPMHSGHLDIIKKYSEYPGVKEVKVFMGPGIRDGINQSTAISIAEKLTEGLDKVSIKTSKISPMLDSYKFLENAKPGTYALAASSKEEENSKRIKSFVSKHSFGGKFFKEGINVIKLPIDITPLNFMGRLDEYEGKPISSSILRQDILNEDKKNFRAGYPNLEWEKIEYVWDKLSEVISTSTTKSSYGNYSRSQPGYAYKDTFPIAEDGEEDIEDEKEEDIKNKK